ncbi:MAG TPA: hypothetical protein VMV81_11580 [Phycisphaerae bacterium]|nr:hypothetical protein [Phycisphaerae bacterium]
MAAPTPLNGKSFDGPYVRHMRHHAHPRAVIFLIGVLTVLWTSACKRDRNIRAMDAGPMVKVDVRRDAGICEEQPFPARRAFSNVIWDCIEKLEGPRPERFATAITMEHATDGGTGIVFSVEMIGPHGAASKALDGPMVRCAVDEYRRCPASYDRALWRWKDSKWIQMGRPNRDDLGPAFE